MLLVVVVYGDMQSFNCRLAGHDNGSAVASLVVAFAVPVLLYSGRRTAVALSGTTRDHLGLFLFPPLDTPPPTQPGRGASRMQGKTA